MKRGGSNMGYTEQFDLLSPCYKKGDQPAGFRMGGAKAKPTKKGKKETTKTKPSTKKPKSSKTKQRGGSSCYASPSVAEMGVVATPASLEPSKSELAWDNRMKGGEPNGNNLLNSQTDSVIKLNNSMKLTQQNVGNNLTKTNQVNNVSTYLNKLKDVVFDKNITTGFAIVVERTSENPTNSKQDKYKIKVIETKNNTPSMSVLVEKSFSDILQTVRDTSSNVFPLKKEGNNNSKIQENAKTGTNNPIGAINYSIPLNNTVSQAASTNATTTGGRKRKNNHK
jgi:hypothetical protein